VNNFDNAGYKIAFERYRHIRDRHIEYPLAYRIPFRNNRPMSVKDRDTLLNKWAHSTA
jgi:hypothetical protein